MRNCITDVTGVLVGHADDPVALTGTTAILFETPAIAAADIRGGGPGTRDVVLLNPDNTVERVDGFVLSGGSAFGLDSAGGVQTWLAEQGRGLKVGTAGAVSPPERIACVPAARLSRYSGSGSTVCDRNA